MRQNFRRQYYHLITDPALPLILPLCLLYALGLGLSCPFLWVPALVLVLALALWQKFFRVGIGRNFQALPALPGGYRTIGQRVQKGSRVQTCGELRRSLIEDSRDAITRIPAGRYQALTHEAVLRRLERSTRVSVEKIFPAYMGTLRPVLLAQTHKRCRHCKAPCSAREAPVRWFYLVQFCVAENKEEVTMKKQTLFCRIEKLLNKFSKKAGKKVVSIIFIACISIGLFVIPASAITYEATFMYYLLDPETGKYEYYGRSFYRASGSDSVPNDTFILGVGLYPYYAPPELINDGYTSTHDYYRTDEHSWVSGDTSKYTITYNFSPVLFGVTYQLDGTSYQTQNYYYQNTVAVLPIPAKTGYTFSGWSSSDVTLAGGSFTMPAKNITIQGAYLIHSNALKYEYAGTVPKNAPALPLGNAYNYGTTVNVASLPTVSGYTFGGWTSSNATLTGGSFIMPDNPVTITGIWTPRADTPYTVERYQQNIDDDGYMLVDADHYTGTTDTVANVPGKNYSGFSTTPESLAATSDVSIQGDGSTLLKLYYNRNVNAVSYACSGKTDTTAPALPVAASYRFGQIVPMAATPSLAGYDFGGWETSGASVANGSFTMPDSAVSITGAWLPRTDTHYIVERYQQNTEDDGYTLAETLNGKGATGGSIPHREFVGFTQTLDSVTAEGNAQIKSDGSTLLKIYYDRNVNTVSYAYLGELDTAAPTLPIGGSYRYGQTVPMAAAPTLPGYNFGGWETADAPIGGGSFTMPDAAVSITGAWTARTDTPYSVEYYQQNIEDDGYTLTDIEHCTGTTGGEAMVPDKSYPGFSVTPESTSAVTNVLIKSDGTTMLKLYYDRNTETVTYAYSGETDATPPELPSTASYRYGQTVPVAAAPSLTGYDFGGWKTSDAPVVDGSFTMPDEAVTLTGAWTTRTDIPYVIEYYQQNAEDDGYTLADTLNGEGAIGGSIPHREFEGFTETPDSVTAEGNARIRSDGSTVLKLYYDRDYYAVSFAYSGSAPEAAPALPNKANYRYGTSVPLPIIPSVAGSMSFSGWAADNVPILGNTLSVPAQDTKITGTWTQLFDSGETPIPDTPVTPVTLEDNGTAYIIGYEDGAFRPDDYLTAKHETLMLSRLGLPVISPGVAPELSAEERYITRKEFLGTLLNASSAAGEDSEPMAEAAALGWISGYGDGELYPEAYITRAQAVTIINRAFGRTAAQAGSAQINYTDIPRDYWAYDAIMAASTTA